MERLNSAELLDRAAKQTGLADFGPDTFREGLDVLIESAEAEAGLTPAGRDTLAAMITSRLANRLQLYDWHKRFPEIGQQEIKAPVIVIGLWRTGTTLLSYVLGQDPASYSLVRWQAACPAPPPGLDARADRERIARVEAQIEAQLASAPELAAINLQEAGGPTECVLPLSHDFRNTLFDCSLNIPSFYDWNRGADQRSAYELHRKTLQLLQWRQAPAERWQLKAPGHTLSLDALLQVYPDARFIISHRDPAQSFASACDFWELQMRGFTEKPDPLAIGRNWVRIYDDALDALMAFVRRHDPARVVHLSFAELRDTMASVSKVYEHLGLPMGAEVRARMQAFIDQPRPSNPGGHSYSLERYGFTRGELHERWHDYMAAFDMGAMA